MEGDPEHTDKRCLVIYQTVELTDNTTVPLSKVLNLRTSAFNLKMHVITVHANLTDSKAGDEY